MNIFIGTREICYVCDGENDNEICNSQGIEECEIGEVIVLFNKLWEFIMFYYF